MEKQLDLDLMKVRLTTAKHKDGGTALILTGPTKKVSILGQPSVFTKTLGVFYSKAALEAAWEFFTANDGMRLEHEIPADAK